MGIAVSSVLGFSGDLWVSLSLPCWVSAEICGYCCLFRAGFQRTSVSIAVSSVLDFGGDL